MMIVVGVAAFAFAMIKWILIDAIQPRVHMKIGGTHFYSRRLTSKELEAMGKSKPWYFVEPSPSDLKEP